MMYAKTTRKAKTKLPTPKAHDNNVLRVPTAPDKSKERLTAELAVDGLAGNVATITKFIKGTLGEVPLSESMHTLKDNIAAVHGGDLRGAESLLVAQAATLNAMFVELARRAAMNMGEHLGATESYMRLALKAQGQCRATLEALAAIKNPPVVFARQANINNGGQQQVNNGAAADMRPVRASAHAQAANLEAPQTGLLGAGNGQRLDTRAAGTASSADSELEAVAAVHRAAHG